jgi:hypothetical protein
MAMVANLSTNTFDLAALLHEARENNYPTAWGFSSLADYASQELGLKQRKSEYLTRIMRVTKAVGLTRPQFEPCGVSKLREITRLDPEGTFWNKDEHVSEDLAEHIVRLILDSDKMNVEQVKEEVARLKGQVGKDRRVIRSYSTDVTTWTLVISAAIEKARKYLGSKGRDEETGNAVEYSEGACYECICAAFNADLNYEEDPGDNPKLPTEEKDMQDYINAELPMEEF